MDKQLEIDFTQWEDWGHATLLMLMYTNIITHTWQFPQYKVQLGHMHAARGLPQYTTGTHDVIMHKNYE